MFLAQARGAEAKGRAFANRDALEESFASMGVRCLPLLEGEGGIKAGTSISDAERCLYDALPRHLRVCRGRVVVVYPDRHVYSEEPGGLSHHLAKHLARNCRVFTETVAGAASADVTILEDLDSVRLDPYRAFVTVDEAFLTKWRIDHPNQGGRCSTEPSVMLNVAAGFKSKADVSREAAEKRKAELAKVVAPGDFKMKDNSSRKKEPYDYENYLKPNGVLDLARLEALQADFEGQLERYQLAVGAKTKIQPGFFKWRGHYVKSKKILAEALDCKTIPYGTAPEVMAEFVRLLGEKIKEVKASTAG